MEFVSELGLVAMGSRMRALSERLYAIADEVYQRGGIAVQGRWFPLLRLLHDRGPQSVGEIAQAIGQTHSAVSQLAARLSRDGWLVAKADATDKRLRRLGLTAKADAALRDAKPAWRAIQEVLEARCGEAGIDMPGTLTAFARLLESPIQDEIAERTLALQREAVRVVTFQPALREHFHRLNVEWLRKYFYVEEIDERVLSNPEAEILAAGGEVFFALLGDAVVGTCALKREAGDALELTKMAVDGRYQGLGIGRRLIEAAIGEFVRRGGTSLFLETNSKLAPAIKLYESVGFEHQPTVRPDSHYQRADVYMVWRAPAAKPKGAPRGRAGTAAAAPKR
ncbi:MAG: bifunctional helix-turn-helix transcriptional regulator/GNAT family N-acetyltransferase [Pseudomonadota bacterium]|nr:bifunctional helix-turn-helix transcriptional regulator/GNAT family N-acetyltransferase [Pseudomonadota bacterium]